MKMDIGERTRIQLPSGQLDLPVTRCQKCRRRLFDGFLFGIIKCPYCNWLTKFIDNKAGEVYAGAKVAK